MMPGARRFATSVVSRMLLNVVVARAPCRGRPDPDRARACATERARAARGGNRGGLFGVR